MSAEDDVITTTEVTESIKNVPLTDEGKEVVDTMDQILREISYQDLTDLQWNELRKKRDEAIKASLTTKEETETESYYQDSGSNDMSLEKSGIWGMPFQFTEQADPRINNNHGRVFYQKVLTNLPLVIFQIGKPRFMDGGKFLGDSKLSGVVKKALAIQDEDEQERVLNNLSMSGAFNETRYYSFQDDFVTYTNYVNTLCRFTAIKMGLAHHNNFDIKSYREDNLVDRLLGMNNYMAFYVTTSTNYNESGSNSTGDSRLSGLIKGAGSLKREIDFLFGRNQSDISSLDTASYNETIGTLASELGGDPQSFLSRITSMGKSVMSGGNLLFPEIWQDSSFRKSYTVDIKLHSPYGDKESIFMNIYVPLLALLALALPRQSGKQAYEGPFVIKMFSKGWFNCDLGMVESIDIRKGGGSNNDWNQDFLPLEVDVSLSIKDLYPTIMLTTSKGRGSLFANNTGLTEYLNLMSGVNLLKINPLKSIETNIAMAIGSIESAIPEASYRITHTLSKINRNLINKIFGGLM